ncbi:flagellar motor switch protein FliG [Maritimibacter sp. 55A14]|uniref:flagellar motor switch protein FliG n=1 Tax=Maritimibacter sp. 55A14 TaxID=2174844 RepID=UPI000D622D61|nr:FliG C-terminal domain-containing protein [Maritimibacter sp. 55A14]PWE30629.1 flagellar motor switch protein FliG [Maritimibacter sp. 55A14]
MGAPCKSRPRRACLPIRVAARALAKRQKAAVIVRLLLDGGTIPALSHLDDQMQADLTAAMAGMRYVDRETLIAVVLEFLEEMESIGITFPGGLDRALALLENHISAGASDYLRRAQAAHGGADPWARIAGLEPETLMPFIAGESPLVAAVVLSKLSTAKAAALLERMPGAQARAVALAIPATEGTPPETVTRIGQTLTARLDDRPARAFSDDPAARIGAILNLAPAATRETLLDDLDSADQNFAEQVRRTIFTFADIPERLDPLDVPKALRGIDNDQLVTALAAGGAVAPDAVEFLLDNMSKRKAEQLREEIAERAGVKRKDGEAAHAALIQEIRRLHETGEIVLNSLDKEEED